MLNIPSVLAVCVLTVTVYAVCRTAGYMGRPLSFANALVILLTLLSIVVGAGCTGNPLGPDGVDVKAMRKWAADHALEACVTTADGRTVLVPLANHGDAGYTVVPISRCNPAE